MRVDRWLVRVSCSLPGRTGVSQQIAIELPHVNVSQHVYMKAVIAKMAVGIRDALQEWAVATTGEEVDIMTTVRLGGTFDRGDIQRQGSYEDWPYWRS